jgi:hypothetical protein
MKMRIKIKITIKKENEAKMSVYPPPLFLTSSLPTKQTPGNFKCHHLFSFLSSVAPAISGRSGILVVVTESAVPRS